MYLVQVVQNNSLPDIVPDISYCTTGILIQSAMVNLARSGRAFELRGRIQNSDKWVPPRIEFCVEPIFPIFEYSVFETIYHKSL